MILTSKSNIITNVITNDSYLLKIINIFLIKINKYCSNNLLGGIKVITAVTRAMSFYTVLKRSNEVTTKRRTYNNNN